MAPAKQMLQTWVHMLQLARCKYYLKELPWGARIPFTKGPLNCLGIFPSFVFFINSFAQSSFCMAIPHRSIGEWLRNIDEDLEVYRGEFEELGYNLKFLMETATRLLVESEVESVHLPDRTRDM